MKIDIGYNKPEDFKNNFRVKKKSTKLALTIIFIVFLLVSYYFFLPAINLRSMGMWVYVLVSMLVASLTIGLAFNKAKFILKSTFILFVILLLLNVITLPVFMAKSYSKILEINEKSFTEDVKEIPFKEIPTIDRDTAIRLGSRKMGELLDLVSQFDLEETYTQINLKGRAVRVSPIRYNGFIKWLSNHSKGLPNYMLVDMIDGKTDLVAPKSPIMYSESDLFFRNIKRYTRIKYPSKILGETSFEVSDDNIPYWITSTLSPKIGLFSALDVEGAILVNALDGSCSYYKKEDVPSWVDRLYAATDIEKQLIWNGKFRNGFFNSMFSQKGVLAPTAGYNYLAIDDDVYLYTGLTSVAADDSNVGFVLVNLRTKEASFYPISSAEEFSAMDSAQGEVQEKGYTATFPILLNIKSKPTYFLSLKDNAGLIKTYAFIDAQNYQDVSIGSTVEAAYKNHLGASNIALEDEEIKEEDLVSKKGNIEEIYQLVIAGNTHYYFTLKDDPAIYSANINLSPRLAFLKKGDTISFSYIDRLNLRELKAID